jgi:TrmH family RNA methyltransferase
MDETITSRQNPRVKSAARLRDRSGRAAQDRIIIDGIREINRAVSAGVELIEVFVCELLLHNQGEELLSRCGTTSADIVHVAESVFRKLAFGDRSDGLVAVARPPAYTLNSLQISSETSLAVLEHVEKPGNVGAVVRTADAAGIKAVIVVDAGTDLYNPNAIRASAGTIFSMPLVSVTSGQALAWLQENHFSIVAARVDGAVDYTAAAYGGRCAIVLGSEARGLSDVWQGADVTAVKLPMRGVADSLNVSVTAAVLFYEALRRR